MTRNKVVAVVATLAALGVVAFAAGAGPESPAPVGICIKPNGQLRAETPLSPCVTPEELQHWTVHGVSSIQAGDGLVGQNVDGIASLQVDPALIEQANAGQIFAGFDDGPGLVNGLSRQLALPPGSYAITAKLTIDADLEVPSLPETKYAHDVKCKLAAGADFDRARAIVSGTLTGDETEAMGLSLLVVHRFSEPGDAVLTCTTSLTFDCAPLGCIDDWGPKYTDVKIVAIRAASLSNHFLG